jgi:hypothetical protein
MSGTPATPHTVGLNGMTMVSYSGPDIDGAAEISTQEALAFVGALHGHFPAWSASCVKQAGALLADIALAPEFVDFLTIPGYALVD